MMTQAKPATITRLHAAGGFVWVATDEAPPIRSAANPEVIAQLQEVREANVVRVPGSRLNAALLLALDTPDRSYDLQICGPRECYADHQLGPGAVLEAMRSVRCAPVYGGWQSFDAHRRAIFELIVALDTYGWSSPEARRALHRHPAWPALSFIRGIDEESVAFLLYWIVDPRYFTHKTRPSRITKVEKFLRLDKNTLSNALKRLREGHNPQDRCRTLLRAWACGGPPQTSDLNEPANFLWRVVFAKNLLSDSQDPMPGYLAACRRFICFLRDTWQDAMSPHELFVPEYWFNNSEDAAAFRRHMDAIREGDSPSGA